MGQDDYRYTDSLPTISFIAGSDYKVNFYTYNTGGNPVNINAGTMDWYLSPYGSLDTLTLHLNGIAGASNLFVLSINGSSTSALHGVYTYQPKITDFSGKPIKTGQGMVIIRKAIPTA